MNTGSSQNSLAVGGRNIEHVSVWSSDGLRYSDAKRRAVRRDLRKFEFLFASLSAVVSSVFIFYPFIIKFGATDTSLSASWLTVLLFSCMGLVAASFSDAVIFPKTKKPLADLLKNGKLQFETTFSIESKRIVDRAIILSGRENSRNSPIFLAKALIESPEVVGVFARAGISTLVLAEYLSSLTQHGFVGGAEKDFDEVLRISAKEAVVSGETTVSPSLILFAVLQNFLELKNFVYKLGASDELIDQIVRSLRRRERLFEELRKFRSAAGELDRYGLDKAMTAVATPFLNSLGHDRTLSAKFYGTAPCVSREKELAEICRVFESGRLGCLLVGENGVGRRTLVDGLIELITLDRVPKRLKEKRVVEITASALSAFSRSSYDLSSGIWRIVREAGRARNVLLFLPSLEDFSSGDADLSKAFLDALGESGVPVIATTTATAYRESVSRSALGSRLSALTVKEFNPVEAVEALEAHANLIEWREKAFFSFESLSQAAFLAKRHLSRERLPGSAISLLSEAAAKAVNGRGQWTMVSGQDVAEIVEEKTGVPVPSVTKGEAERLMSLESEMKKRVVGQEQAVSAVARALRRARTSLSSDKRPLASFLLLGPTGVGKTELAKTIADIYFGGEKQMLRFDMSEFRGSTGLERLLGRPGSPGTGLFTEAVRARPFSLVLLDELEKASPEVHNVFLQTLDDGRITDSSGETVDCTNTMIIATSNAGTEYATSAFAEGKNSTEILRELMHKELQGVFRPEFLNRFDAVVLFEPLDEFVVKEIAKKMIDDVSQSLAKQGLELRVTDEAIAHLTEVGFDKVFGARPMRRAVQDRLEGPLADFILQENPERGSILVVDGDFRVSVLI